MKRIKINSDIDSDFITFNLDYNAINIQKCLDVVRKYIIDKQLMIVGGMSIDFALKLKGDNLYSNYQIPDYDVIDPDNINHANNISTLLCEIGMKNISIVPAVHKTTIRVQIMGYTVFDSTFVPEYLYKKIPYMRYENYKFIDPVYQKIDQYTSLSLLWNITGPAFNIINRLEKDLKRKEMLSKYYNFSEEHLDKNINIKTKNIKLNSVSFNKINKVIQSDNNIFSIDLDFIFHGKLAYCFIYEEYAEICKKYNIQNNALLKYKIHKNTNNIMQFEYSGKNIEIINYGNGFRDNKTFNIMMSEYDISKFIQTNQGFISTSMPALTSFESNDYDIKLNSIDMTGNMLSINKIKSAKLKDTFYISNYNYILALFLFSFYFEDDIEEKNIYAAYYLSLLRIVENVQSIDEYMNKLEDNCFYLSLNNLGIEYWKDENLLFYMQNYNNIKETRRGLNTIPPKNYISNPDCEIKKKFSNEDRNNSTFYVDIIQSVKETNFLKELNEII